MKKYIPSFLKYPLISIYILWKVVMRGEKNSRLRLNLAGVLPPTGAIVHGGKVKLLALREKFGDSWKRFNIAYFASSGLPFAPSIWLRLYKLFNIKIVWNQNGVAYPAWAHGKAKKINFLMKSIHLADYVIFQTEFTKKCSDIFLGAYTGKYEILVNPVDTTRFFPRPEPLPREPLIIMMSGHHFESPERLTISLEAVRNIPGARLLVVGNKQPIPHEDWIETVGTFTQEEAPHLYHRAHIMLHLKSLDPCPTFVLEALASGLPVVGLNNGGMPELVSKESGILLDSPEDFNAFHYPAPHLVSEAIQQISTNLGTYSRNAREQALTFDTKKWLARHEQIFNTLLS